MHWTKRFWTSSRATLVFHPRTWQSSVAFPAQPSISAFSDSSN